MAVVSPCDRAARARGEAVRAEKSAPIEELMPADGASAAFAMIGISAHPASCSAAKIHELPWHPEGAAMTAFEKAAAAADMLSRL